MSGLSNRAVAERCGVDDKTAGAVRGPGEEIPHLKRTGLDGKEYPAHPQAAEQGEAQPDERTTVKPTPWDWLPPLPFRCPRCGTVTLTREAGARCPACGYVEGS